MLLIETGLGLLCASMILGMMFHISCMANRYMINHTSGKHSLKELLWEPDGVEEWMETSDGARLRILHKGSGRPVLLLHDIGFSSTMMNLMWKGLAAYGFRVITYDQREHGQSSKGSASISLDVLAEDLQSVIECMDLRSCILVGHAGSCSIAFRYLLNFRADAGRRISGMLSIAGFAGSMIRGIATHSQSLQQKLFRYAWFRSLLRHKFYGFGFASTAFGEQASPQQVRAYLELILARPLKRLQPLFQELSYLDDYPKLPQISIPMIATASRQDQRVHPIHTAKIAQAIPFARLLWAEEGGNMLIWEQSNRMVDFVRALDKELLTPQKENSHAKQ